MLEITVVDSGVDTADAGPTKRASWAWINPIEKASQLPAIKLYGNERLAMRSSSQRLAHLEWQLGPIRTAFGCGSDRVGTLCQPGGSAHRTRVTLTGASCQLCCYLCCFQEQHECVYLSQRMLRRSVPGGPSFAQCRTPTSVTFVWNRTVTRLQYRGDAFSGVECYCKDAREELLSLFADTSERMTTSKIHRATLTADIIVVAAGVGSTDSALGGLPLRHRPGSNAFLHLPPNRSQAALLSRILVDADCRTLVLQRRDGTIVAGLLVSDIWKLVALIVVPRSPSLQLLKRPHDRMRFLWWQVHVNWHQSRCGMQLARILLII